MIRALFGGTFDPIHFGHLLMAEAARDQFHLDRVLFVPTGQPPHKVAPSAKAKDRLTMVRLALRGNPAFSVTDWEIRQGRTVYSYETLEHFSRQWPDERLSFIVGSDSLASLGQWRRGPELLRRYRFLVIERPGVPWNRLPERLRRRARLVKCPPVSFASQDIRRQIHGGHSIRYEVPPAVDAYIQRHCLYR